MRIAVTILLAFALTAYPATNVLLSGRSDVAGKVRFNYTAIDIPSGMTAGWNFESYSGGKFAASVGGTGIFQLNQTASAANFKVDSMVFYLNRYLSESECQIFWNSGLGRTVN